MMVAISDFAFRWSTTTYRHRYSLAWTQRLFSFDEPTSALDPELVGEVLAVIRKIAKS